jgi:hypothetical protein
MASDYTGKEPRNSTSQALLQMQIPLLRQYFQEELQSKRSFQEAHRLETFQMSILPENLHSEWKLRKASEERARSIKRKCEFKHE